MDNTRLEEVLGRAEQSLDAKDAALIRAVFQSYLYVTDLVEDKNTSIRRLRQLFFGKRTEKTKAVVGSGKPEATPEEATSRSEAAADTAPAAGEPVKDRSNEADTRPAAPGHGRNGADAYRGAERIEIPHPSLAAGDPCPSSAGPEKPDRTDARPRPAQEVHRHDRLPCPRRPRPVQKFFRVHYVGARQERSPAPLRHRSGLGHPARPVVPAGLATMAQDFRICASRFFQGVRQDAQPVEVVILVDGLGQPCNSATVPKQPGRVDGFAPEPADLELAVRQQGQEGFHSPVVAQ